MDLLKLVQEAEAEVGQPPLYDIRARRIKGKVRMIAWNKNRTIIRIHEKLSSYLLTLFARKLPDAQKWATNYFPGSSPLGNAEWHCHNRFFYVFDLESAFPSVTANSLARVLVRVDPTLYYLGALSPDKNPEDSQVADVEMFLAKYCIHPHHGLVQGLSANPHLFNIAFAFIDAQVASYCEARGWRYTRCADDITISSLHPTSSKERRRLRAFFTKAGYRISHKPGKSAVLDIERGAVMITKVILCRDGTVITRAGLLRSLRKALTLDLDRMHSHQSARVHYLLGLLKASHPPRTKWGKAEQHVLDLHAAWLRDI